MKHSQLLLFIALAWMLVACHDIQQSTNIRTYDISEPETRISIKAPYRFALSLPENLGTGYFWSVTLNDNRINSTGANDSAENLSEGATSKRVFLFEAVKPGNSSIMLSLARASDNEPIEVRHVYVTIED